MGSQSSAGAKYCQECGARLSAESKFCQSCGAKVPQEIKPGGGVQFGDVGLFRGSIDQSTHTTSTTDQSTHIGSQTNFAGPVTVHIQQGLAAPTAQDFFQQGLNSLRCQVYPQATASFNQAAGAGLNSGELYYYLALAALGGRRPRAQTFATIQTVQKHLKTAVERSPSLHRAFLLWSLVVEDYFVLNRLTEPAPGAASLFSQSYGVSKAECEEIVFHLNAPGNRIWEKIR